VSELRTAQLEIRGGRGNQHRRGDKVVGYAVVRDDKFTADVLSKMSWCLTAQGYPATRVRLSDGKSTVKLLHQIVFEHYHGQVPPGLEIDHADQDKWNAVPTNLRAVTRTLNVANSPRRKNNRSGYKGVSKFYNPGLNKYYWCLDSRIGGKRTTRYFPFTAEGKLEAALLYNDLCRTHHPEALIPNPEAGLL
jgi:hypothetical protein